MKSSIESEIGSETSDKIILQEQHDPTVELPSSLPPEEADMLVIQPDIAEEHVSEEETLEKLLIRPNNIPCIGFHKEIVKRTDNPKRVDMYIYPPPDQTAITKRATNSNTLRSGKDVTRYLAEIRKAGISLPNGCSKSSFGKFYTKVSSLNEEDKKLLRAAQLVADKKATEAEEIIEQDDTEEEEEEEDENIFKKLELEVHSDFLLNFHPEIMQINFEELNALSRIIRDNNGRIADDLHQTIPFMTKYERTRILGIRAKQLNNGASPFIPLGEEMMSGYTIAQQELKEKKIPYIIRRPLPNGASEYWKIEDLEILN